MASVNLDDRIRAYLAALGPNEGFAEELFRDFSSNPQAVPSSWREAFEAALAGTTNGHKAGSIPALSAVGAAPGVGVIQSPQEPGAEARPEPLRGAAARIALNMAASLAVPTATSQRIIPMRLAEENRRLLNQQLAPRGRKLSLTHILAWAILRALQRHPAMNRAYGEWEGQPARLDPGHVHLGLAVDVAARGGGRTLLVPVLHQAETLNFSDFVTETDRLIQGARQGQLAPADLRGATMTLTNPGTLGTQASVPRLMPGQGAIIAAGALAYPSGFEGMPEDTLHALGVGKVMSLTCTYDHRILQGAESGEFLATISALLLGEDDFHENLFRQLDLPFHAVRWSRDASPGAIGLGGHDLEAVRKQAAVLQLVHAYRVRGHLLAQLDPLATAAPEHPELDPGHYGLSLWDYDRKFLTSLSGEPAETGPPMQTLRTILNVLRTTYCGTLACEYMHIQNLDRRLWLQRRLEPAQGHWPLAAPQKRRLLEKLSAAEAFERLLHSRYIGHKRFSLEGADSLIPALDGLLARAASEGMEEVLLGMAHRGRLNVLVNIIGQSMAAMLSRFEDIDPESVQGSGDVKYHLGAEGIYRGQDREMRLWMAPNPSHLEAVDPMLEGAARARQELLDDAAGRRVLPLLIHGDAAFAGQGVVAETLNLSQLDGYAVGGTLHIIVNNRIGFTTAPGAARSSLYCTDVARMVQAPIFHVNGDDPEAVARGLHLAFDYRNEFHGDVVVDIVCYRRHGHNEGDDPSLTLPVLYRNIESHPTPRAIYAAQLEREKILAPGEADAILTAERDKLDARPAAHPASSAAPHTAGLAAPHASPSAAPVTAVPADRLREIARGLAATPAGFVIHPKLKPWLEKRTRAVTDAQAVDWALAESLAFGSLLLDGVPIRLTGQDTARGTFSQRHLTLADYHSGDLYTPLEHLPGRQADFAVHDSLLSEEAALGFEYGYSTIHPTALVLWEAQFGDFANGAEVMIDQFLAAAYSKWGRTSGITLLLPHGYEGQGPEHSSARPERFLQLCAENNLRIANCTTSAQYFHLLRRQGLSGASAPETRRPLVIFTPKSLLRSTAAASSLPEFIQSGFAPVLRETETSVLDAHCRRVLLCSGKIYYELAARRRERNDSTTAIVRVELLYPWPQTSLKSALSGFPQEAAYRWVQEEPENMGAWNYVTQRWPALHKGNIQYIGRTEAASPATGSLRRHQKEQQALLDHAFAD